jgi:hypothetical protein
MQAVRDNRRFILIGLVLLVLLCLVVLLIYRIFVEEEDGGIVGEAATATPTLALTGEAAPEEAATPGEEATTPTPTRVIAEASPTAETTAEATAGLVGPQTPSTSPSPAVVVTRLPATATPAAPGGAVSTPPGVTARPPRIEQLLKNGDFEEGFDEAGVALQWDSFKNDSAVVIFAAETAPQYVKSGAAAQRIIVVQAMQGNRYAGIYQPVQVVPDQPYTLTLNGQIRTGLGDINASSYGYRMQYAIDEQGGTNWMRIPDQAWIELPWDEQRFDDPDPQFLSYTTVITPTSETLTLFVRTWNKWPDPGEAQYTLDSLSLIGFLPGSTTDTGTAREQLIDGGLPTTGASDPPGFIHDGRFWGAVLILLLLASGAIYRARWGW